MISKNQIKLITSLQHKKFRNSSQLFFVEGVKAVCELLDSNYILEHLYTTQNDFENVPDEYKTIISENDLKKITALATPNSCLALFKIPVQKPVVETKVIVMLDSIRDPGNLGTILRLCDWYGVQQVICSIDTVDIFNPKVVQATMGSLTRINVNYIDLKSFLLQTKLSIFGTFMDGQNIYKLALPQQGIIIMGNEANGISVELEELIQNRISIPQYGAVQKTESLNVATATAIVLSEFYRNQIV